MLLLRNMDEVEKDVQLCTVCLFHTTTYHNVTMSTKLLTVRGLDGNIKPRALVQ